MVNLEPAAILRILVAKSVEAMRACCHDLSDSVLIQPADVVSRQRFKQKLIADPPRRIAGTFFLPAHDRKVDSRLGQKLGRRAGNSLVAFDERSTTTNPQKYFRIRRVLDLANVQALGPIN